SHGGAWSNQAKAEEGRVKQQQTTTGSGHEAGATDKGKAAAQSNLWPSISSYLPATLGELLPSAVNTYIVLIHVYLACSTVVLILWSLGVSQSRIMHYLHQQLLAGRTTLLELKKHALDSMAHIISCLHQHLLATRTTFLKLMNDALDFMATRGTSFRQATRHVFAAKPGMGDSATENAEHLGLARQIDNLTAEMNSKMNSMMQLLQTVKREVEAGRRVSQSEPNEEGTCNNGLDGLQHSSMEERQVQAEAWEEEGHPLQGLSESGVRMLEEMLEECRMQMRMIRVLKARREMVDLGELEEVEEEEAAAGEECEPWDEQELETWIQFLERVLRENRREHEEGSERMGSTGGVVTGDDEAGMSAGVVRLGEEEDGDMMESRERRADTGGRSGDIKSDVAGVGTEVERMKGDVERLKNAMARKARMEEGRERDIGSLRREVEGLKSCSGEASKCLDELRGEMKAEMAVLVEQSERRVFGKLDEWRREMEEGRAEEVGRMRELKEEVDAGKAEVVGRLSKINHRLDEGRMEARARAASAASALQDRERVEGLSVRLGSFQEVTTRVEGEIRALWECWAVREAL
ncbi:unnamed protein product, partial [Closterium sp. Naga37s-1]